MEHRVNQQRQTKATDKLRVCFATCHPGTLSMNSITTISQIMKTDFCKVL